MNKVRKYYLITLFLFFFTAPLIAQINQKGIPFIKNYSTKEYKGSPQNWAAVQDNRGVMFFGNNFGFLEFDGNRWRLVGIPNKTIIRSLAIDQKGRIYVGGQDDFGYLQPDAQGQMEYISLKALIPKAHRDFEDVWKIYATRDGVYFGTFSGIYFLQHNKITFYRMAAGQNAFPFYVHDKLYIPVPGKGIFEIKNGQPAFIPNSDVLANYTITGMLPEENKKVLIFTEQDGIYSFDGINGFKPWVTQAEGFLRKNRITSAVSLANGFAVGSSLGGLLLLDKKGMPKMVLNRENGLQNSHIQHIYQDNSGNIWLGLNNGIDYVEINSPFTLFNAKNGVPGTAYTSLLHQGNLYLGTNNGLFYKKWSEKESPLLSASFKLIEGTQGQVYNLQAVHGKLLLAHHNGAFEIIADKAVKVSEHTGIWLYLPLKAHPGYVICGTYTGLLLYKMEAGKMVFIRKIAGLEESARVMEEDETGTIWVAHGYKGIYRLKLSAGLDKVQKLDFYNAKHGFPSNLFINVFKINNRLVFTGERGIYQFNEKRNRFEEDEELSKYFAKNTHIRKLLPDQEGNIWFSEGDEMGVLQKQDNGAFAIEKKTFNKLEGQLVGGFEHIAAYNASTVLIGTNEGFVLYNPAFPRSKEKENSFYTLIRQVETMAGKRDSLLSGGTYWQAGRISSGQPPGKIPELPHRLNSLRFTYSAISYEEMDKVQYEYILDGYDKNWFSWTALTQKEYTNLTEGDYTFRVRARDIYNRASTEATYRFSILPPWYRSAVAYLFYIFSTLLLLIFIRNILQRRERKERARLKQEQEKAFKLQEAQHLERVLKAEKEIVLLNNDKLAHELDLKNRELASTAMLVTQNLENAHKLRDQLQEVITRVNDVEAQHHMRKILRSVEEEINFENNWEQFEIHFNQIHQDFIKRLRKDFPELTHRDIKLCTYLRLNLSSKEIASLLNLSLRGIETSRYRIRKKMNLDPEVNLTEYILKY